MTRWLSAERLRVDHGGCPLIEELSFDIEEKRVALLGDWDHLFLVLLRRATVASGSFRAFDAPIETALVERRLGLVPESWELPPSWTPLRVFDVSGRLRGLSAKEARLEALAASRRLGLDGLLNRPLGAMPLAEHRAMALLNASLAGPKALLLQSFTRGVDRRGAEFLVEILLRLDLPFAFSYDGGDDQARVLLERCSQVLVLRNGALVAQGSTSILLQSSCYLVRVLGGAKRLAEGLRTAGIAVDDDHVTFEDDRPATLWIELTASQSTQELARVALESQAEVIEVVPMEPAVRGSLEERAMAPE